MEQALDDESDSDTEMDFVTKAGDTKAKVKHEIVMKVETGPHSPITDSDSYLGSSNRRPSSGHSTNFVNELKLSDFKLVLTKNGKNNNISYNFSIMSVCL